MRSLPLVLVIFWFYFLVPYIGQWLTGSSRPVRARLCRGANRRNRSLLAA